MADLLEDAQGTGPGPAGRLVVTRAALDVAQAVERVGLVETISQFPPQIDGPLVTRDGSLAVAEPVMDEAQAVPGSGFPVALSHLADGGQGPLTVGEGLLVLAEPGVAVADVVEDHRLPGVPRRTEQVEGLPGVVQRVGEALLPLGQPGQAAVDSALADLVADPPEQRQGVVETRVGVAEPSRPGVPEGETVQRVGLPGHIVRPAGSLQPGALRQGVLLPGSAAQEEGAERPRQPPGVGIETGLASQPHGGEQPGVLSAEPGRRLLRRGRLPGNDPGLGRAQRDRLEVRFHQHRGVAGRVQVVVQDAMHGCVAGVLAVVGQGLFRGVGTEQVVAGVPPGCVLGGQVRLGQLVQ